VALNRRFAAVLASIAALAAVAGGLAWLVLAFMPIRSGTGGAFLAWAQTPAASAKATRRAVPGSSWPMFGGSAARTRYAPSKLRPPFRVRYAIPGRGGLIEMPPVVSRRRVVFGTHDGLVIASGLGTGRHLWTARLDRCIASSPAVRKGVVYVSWAGTGACRRGKDEQGGIVALSLATGRVLWQFRTGNVEASPAIVGNKLFFSAFRNRGESRVYAMRLNAPRRMLWSYPIASKIASSPAVIGRTLFVSAYDRKLYSFNAWTGKLRWEASAFSDDAEVRFLLGVKSLVKRRAWKEGGYYATPAVAYRRAYLGTIDGVFSAFDARTGAHRWSRRLDGSIYGSAALWHESVFVGTTSGSFQALSARDGRELWKHELEGRILGSPTVTNGHVFIATTARETFVFDAETGWLEWRFPDGHYSPLVVAGKSALLVGKGRVYGIRNAADTSGWRAR
jgi:outer membrane protein assembly factor BamB